VPSSDHPWGFFLWFHYSCLYTLISINIILYSVPIVPNQPRAIYLWVSNSARSSYFSLSVESHTFFRLNYPLRLNRWYHSCTSWNGRTGEWQIWVNAERVGRGFHNRVRILIPGAIQIIAAELLLTPAPSSDHVTISVHGYKNK
jgi:hypothetical protein